MECNFAAICEGKQSKRNIISHNSQNYGNFMYNLTEYN